MHLRNREQKKMRAAFLYKDWSLPRAKNES